MDKVVSTADLPEQDRFDFWREEIGKQHLQYDLDRIEWDTPFQAELQGAVLGEVIFSRSRLSAVRGRRTERHIANDSLDHYVLGLPVEQSIVVQDGIEYALAENEMVLFDGTRPLSYRHGDGRGGIMIAIPRHFLEGRLKNSEIKGPRVAPLDSGVGLMVRSYCQTLPAVVKSCPTADLREALAEQLIALVALAFEATEQSVEEVRPTLGRLRFQAVKDYIDGHSHEPDLSPDRVGKAMGISRSYLYKLFADHDFSFQDYIRGLRLNRAAADLRNPSLSASSITDIAVRAGFSNMSHFSRCFSRRFGEAPRAFRVRRLPVLR